MANMSYCRFENTLSDLSDCHEQLKQMAGGEEFDDISAANWQERLARTRFCLAVLAAAETIRDALGLEADDFGDVSKEQVNAWIANCEAQQAKREEAEVNAAFEAGHRDDGRRV